jgi:hypothetical protein
MRGEAGLRQLELGKSCDNWDSDGGKDFMFLAVRNSCKKKTVKVATTSKRGINTPYTVVRHPVRSDTGGDHEHAVRAIQGSQIMNIYKS